MDSLAGSSLPPQPRAPSSTASLRRPQPWDLARCWVLGAGSRVARAARGPGNWEAGGPRRGRGLNRRLGGRHRLAAGSPGGSGCAGPSSVTHPAPHPVAGRGPSGFHPRPAPLSRDNLTQHGEPGCPPPCWLLLTGGGEAVGNVILHSERTEPSVQWDNLVSVLGRVGTSLPLKWEAVCLSFRGCLCVSFSWIFVGPPDGLWAFGVCMLIHLGVTVTTTSRSPLYLKKHTLDTLSVSLSKMSSKPGPQEAQRSLSEAPLGGFSTLQGS